MKPSEYVSRRLNELREGGLYRVLPDPAQLLGSVTDGLRTSGELLDAAANDYLGYGAEPVSRETLIGCIGLPIGGRASRLISGSATEHLLLEQELATWVHQPAALLFSSGYAANVGALTALTDERSVVISDALNHASIIDGCRLSRATVRIVPHCDIGAIGRALSAVRDSSSVWVVTETYFSMDADGPNLRELRAVCDDYSAGLIVDEAHALGLSGPEGAGQSAEQGVRPDVLIGTLGKAVGVQGAFVAAPNETVELLWNRARSFVFSTATAPLLARLIRLRVERARADDAQRLRLAAMTARVREELSIRRVPVAPRSHGPILPIIFGDVDRTVRASTLLRQRSVWAPAIRPPTVPKGTARLRITLTASWPESSERRLVDALSEVCAAL